MFRLTGSRFQGRCTGKRDVVFPAEVLLQVVFQLLEPIVAGPPREPSRYRLCELVRESEHTCQGASPPAHTRDASLGSDFCVAPEGAGEPGRLHGALGWLGSPSPFQQDSVPKRSKTCGTAGDPAAILPEVFAGSLMLSSGVGAAGEPPAPDELQVVGG